jgi:hypothetical protein
MPYPSCVPGRNLISYLLLGALTLLAGLGAALGVVAAPSGTQPQPVASSSVTCAAGLQCSVMPQFPEGDRNCVLDGLRRIASSGGNLGSRNDVKAVIAKCERHSIMFKSDTHWFG